MNGGLRPGRQLEARHLESIPSENLQLEQLPPSDADWPQVWRLADTFNGYKHLGSFERCAEVANQQRNSTLTALRTCLFFECRRWHHYGVDPEGYEASYIRGLVEQIRVMVAAGRVE
jgi:hypothetical protein